MSKLPKGVYLAFCPTGDGGGIDPHCSPANKGKGKKTADKDLWKTDAKFALAAYANEGYRLINRYLRSSYTSLEQMRDIAETKKKELNAIARAAKKAGDENARYAAVTEASEFEFISRELKGFEKENGISIEETIKTLDKLIAEADTTNAPTTLYRGIDQHFAATLQEGQVFTDNGFVSTAHSRNAADKFGVNLMTIKVKPNAPRLVLNTDEDEVLLPRGSRLRITGTQQIQHFRLFEAELL